jgi:hypothetical protein
MRHRIGAEWPVECECRTGEHGRADPESQAVGQNRILGASDGSQPSKRECEAQQYDARDGRSLKGEVDSMAK